MSPRAVTLIEVLVTVSILSVMAAMAVPNLLPLRDRLTISGLGSQVAGMLDDARRRAVADGRCYRVRAPTTTSLVTERRNSSDCRHLNLDGWSTVRTVQLAATIAIDSAPLATGDDRLVFRPNGRLRGDDDLLTAEEGARIVLTLPGSSPLTAVVGVTQVGRICVTTPASPPTFSAATVCP